jgi:SWI/SNF-related matrix-associated actin-dependent regulator of chromatin subfamily A-like protein 1
MKFPFRDLMPDGRFMDESPPVPRKSVPREEKPDGATVVVNAKREIVVRAPFNRLATDAARDIEGRRWDGEAKVNVFPGYAADAVRWWLDKFYPGTDQTPLDRLGEVTMADFVQVEERDALLAVTTPYDRRFIDAMHRLPECRWVKDERVWLVPLDRAKAMTDVMREVFGIDRSALDEIVERQCEERALATAADTKDKITLPGGELYPFQVTGVNFLERKNGCGLLCDEMGLGKSAQSIAYLYRNQNDALPALIVSPAGALKENWRREIQKWTGGELTCRVFESKNIGEMALERPDVTVVNYDILGKLFYEDENGAIDLKTPTAACARMGFRTVIFDESHMVKNKGAIRSKAARALAHASPHRILLSGTPMMNRPHELWHQLHMIAPQTWEQEWKFKNRYCGPQKNRWGTTFDGVSHLDELHDRLIGHYMVRRLKKDVLTELPDKTRTFVPVTLTAADQKRYAQMMSAAAAEIAQVMEQPEGRRVSDVAIAQLNILRQQIGVMKMPLVAAWAIESLQNTDKVLVFAVHHAVIDGLVERLKAAGVSVAKMDGRDNDRKRNEAKDAFQDGDAQVLVAQILVGGVGHTLTATDQVVFAERTWRPSDHDQAEDRAHRIGQKNCVNVWFMDATESTDEDLRETQESKRANIAQAVDGGKYSRENERGIALEVAVRMLRRVHGEEGQRRFEHFLDGAGETETAEPEAPVAAPVSENDPAPRRRFRVPPAPGTQLKLF